MVRFVARFGYLLGGIGTAMVADTLNVPFWHGIAIAAPNLVFVSLCEIARRDVSPEHRSEVGRVRAWWARLKERANRPIEECPHCGHPWGLGLPHDNTACELKRLRREVADLHTSVSGSNADPT